MQRLVLPEDFKIAEAADRQRIRLCIQGGELLQMGQLLLDPLRIQGLYHIAVGVEPIGLHRVFIVARRKNDLCRGAEGAKLHRQAQSAESRHLYIGEHHIGQNALVLNGVQRCLTAGEHRNLRLRPHLANDALHGIARRDLVVD